MRTCLPPRLMHPASQQQLSRIPPAAQGAGALGLIVLLVSGELKPSYVLGFCIATSNAVGLLGGLFLLGYGLIAIPKQARLLPF